MVEDEAVQQVVDSARACVRACMFGGVRLNTVTTSSTLLTDTYSICAR